MVPSRSRKTPGFRRRSDTLHHNRSQPGIDGGFHFLRADAGHASMVDGTTPEKTRAAIGLLANDGVAGSHWRGAEWISGSENGDGRKTDGGGNMHRAGIV